MYIQVQFYNSLPTFICCYLFFLKARWKAWSQIAGLWILEWNIRNVNMVQVVPGISPRQTQVMGSILAAYRIIYINMYRSTDCIEIHHLDVDFFYSLCPLPAQWMEESERKASLFWLNVLWSAAPSSGETNHVAPHDWSVWILQWIFFKRDWISKARLAVWLPSSKYFGQIWHLKVCSAVAVALLTRKWP